MFACRERLAGLLSQFAFKRLEDTSEELGSPLVQFWSQREGRH